MTPETKTIVRGLVGAVGSAVVALAACAAMQAAPVKVISAKGATARELYGAEKLRAALADLKTAPDGARVLVAVRSAPELAHFDLEEFWPQAQEAFLIKQIGKTWIVTGSDPSGVLYGELELADRIRAGHALPEGIDDMEHPALKLRGTCIGMQKQEITYDGAEYDYPYTPQNFPFFYDKAEWMKYLDMLAEERYNTLYLWNGHPFTSLLKLPKYPEAQELPTCATRPEHRHVQVADRGGGQARHLGAAGVLQHSSLAHICASASSCRITCPRQIRWPALIRAMRSRNLCASIRMPA